jgi:hypothetical protein
MLERGGTRLKLKNSVGGLLGKLPFAMIRFSDGPESPAELPSSPHEFPFSSFSPHLILHCMTHHLGLHVSHGISRPFWMIHLNKPAMHAKKEL